MIDVTKVREEAKYIIENNIFFHEGQTFETISEMLYDREVRKSAPVQKYEIAISYNDTKLRDRIKKMGGQWNGKTWTVSCRPYDLGNLESKVVTSKETTLSNPKSHDTDSNFWKWFLNSGE